MLAGPSEGSVIVSQASIFGSGSWASRQVTLGEGASALRRATWP